VAEHPNVGLVRKGFEAIAAGDLHAAFDRWSPDLHNYGYDAAMSFHAEARTALQPT
jgi:hypothetical protein